jgi:hypothetical protein
VLLLALTASAHAELHFSAPIAFGTGVFPRSIAIADVNLDGRPDLAAANGGTGFGTVIGPASLLLGNGDGTFQAKTDFYTGIDPASVAIADLDGDGKPDLAVSNAGIYHSGHTSTISALIGNGDGTFRSGMDFDAGNYPLSLRIADLNGDGHPDLVVGNEFASTVSVLLGNGDGTFRARAAFPTTSYPTSVAIADLNADGKPDLAVTNLGDPYADHSTVSVLLGNGDGTFRPKADFGTGGGPRSVAIADLNADGRPDLAVVNDWIFGVVGTVSVLLGNGDGTFRSRADFGTADYAQAIAIADLDADGRQDLAVSTDSGVSVLLGNGDGTFGARSDFGVGAGLLSIAIADLDADGRQDIAVTNPNSNAVLVLLNRTAPPPLAMGFEFTPGTLDPTPRGRWVTGFLEPAPPLAAGDIDVSSIRLNGSVPVDAAAPTTLGDHDADGVPDLMVKFDRVAVELTVSEGERVPVTVTGMLDGHPFAGADTIRVRAPHARSQPAAGALPGTIGEGVLGVGPTFSTGTAVGAGASAPAQLALAIRGTNPVVRGHLPVEFTLRDGGPARLELLDVAGRLLASTQVGAMGPGRHSVDLVDERAVLPGIYFLRLSQAGSEVRTRVALLR